MKAKVFVIGFLMMVIACGTIFAQDSKPFRIEINAYGQGFIPTVEYAFPVGESAGLGVGGGVFSSNIDTFDPLIFSGFVRYYPWKADATGFFGNIGYCLKADSISPNHIIGLTVGYRINFLGFLTAHIDLGAEYESSPMSANFGDSHILPSGTLGFGVAL